MTDHNKNNNNALLFPDPEELECMSPRQLMHSGSHYGKANHPNLQSPPIKPSAPEEEISLLLGTLQVPNIILCTSNNL